MKKSYTDELYEWFNDKPTKFCKLGFWESNYLYIYAKRWGDKDKVIVTVRDKRNDETLQDIILCMDTAKREAVDTRLTELIHDWVVDKSYKD